MKLIYIFSVVVLSLFIIVGAICRLKPVHPATHKRSWGAMYLLMAGFAGFAFIDAALGHEPSISVLFGLGAWAFNLYNTQKLWHDKPPASTLKR